MVWLVAEAGVEVRKDVLLSKSTNFNNFSNTKGLGFIPKPLVFLKQIGLH